LKALTELRGKKEKGFNRQNIAEGTQVAKVVEDTNILESFEHSLQKKVIIK